jgi:type IV pilus assembly protein PilE
MNIRQHGFTLIELMITVAIIGILAAIAIPSYQDSVRKSRRADAQGALLSLANAMERHFTETNSYKGAAGTDGTPTDTGDPRESIFKTQGTTGTYYAITILAATDDAYTLQAAPVAGSGQAGNGNLALDSTGQRRWDRNNDGAFPADHSEDKWE